MTNVEQAKQYIAKQKLLGQEKFQFDLGLTYDSVTIIENNEYTWMERDKELIIPSFITKIGQFAFEENKIIESVVFEDNSKLESIGTFTFASCIQLKKIQLPNGLKYIRAMAFYGCDKLESINIPNSVVSISDGAFGNCTNIRKIKIDKDNSKLKEIKNLFNGCSIENSNEIEEIVRINKEK